MRNMPKLVAIWRGGSLEPQFRTEGVNPDSPSNIFGLRKTKHIFLSVSEDYIKKIRSVVLTWCQHLTDGRTDRK